MKRFLALLAFGWLCGCAGVSKTAVKPMDARMLALRHETIASLRERNVSLHSLKGMAAVRYGSKLFGVKGDTAFALQRPEDLRIDALSDFGSFASQVIFSNGRLLILWPSKNRYFSGAADREAVERFLRIGLDGDQVVDLLLSCVPLEPEEDYRVARADEKGIVLRGESGELDLIRSEERTLPQRYLAFDGKGRELYRVTYSDYQEGFPRTLAAVFREPKSQIEVLFKDVELNPKMDKKVFEQRIPPDATPLENY